MKPLLLLTVCLLLALLGLGQGEANIWYFGTNAGVDFNSGAPVALSNSQMSTWEGCASIADAAGALEFYTDGITVWTHTHAVMMNGTGLMGNFSATQSAIIVPRPNSPGIYYIFTVDETASANGLRYSEVDMSLNGGLGAVTGVKNVLLTTPVLEKVTAVQHANGVDVWVVSHEYNNNNFVAYQVTSTGVITTAVVSSVGQALTSGGFASVGYLKASPDGDRLASAHSNGPGNVEVLDFDNATGQVSNPIIIQNANLYAPYGVEFSVDGDILYVSEWGPDLFQFDLLAGNAAAINNSIVQLPTTQWGQLGGLQMGPDAIIYVANAGTNFLSAINAPGVVGLGCNFMQNQVALSSACQYGLPPFIQSYFSANGTADANCFGDSTLFTLATQNPDSVLWTFGDPASGVSDTSTVFDPLHLYPAVGTYGATLIVWSGGVADTIDIEVEIQGLPVVDLGPDTSVCDGETLVLDPGFTNATYIWADSATTATYSVTQGGTYWVEVTDSGCSAADTILVSLLPQAVFSLGADTTVCPGESVTFSAATPNCTYEWDDASTGPTRTVSAAGTYWVEVTLGTCTSSDVVTLSLFSEPMANLGPDTSVCEGDTLWFDVAAPGATYTWWNNGAGGTNYIEQTGQAWVEVELNGCLASDSVNVFFQTASSIDLGPNIYKCEGQFYMLDAPQTQGSYVWSDGTSVPQLSITASGAYWVDVQAGSCVLSDTVNAYFYPNPVVDLGPDTAICEDASLVLSAGNPGAIYGWDNLQTSPVRVVDEAGWYWVNVTTTGCTTRDSIYVDLKPLPVVSLGPDAAICEGDALTLNATLEGATYRWQDESELAWYAVTSPGEYWVEVALNGCYSHDVIQVEQAPTPRIELGPDTAICENTSLMLDASWPDAVSFWSTGELGGILPVNRPGVYAVTVRLDGCEARDSILVRVDPMPWVTVPETVDLCEFESVTLKPDADFSTRLRWPDASKDRSFEVFEGGAVEVEAYNHCGVVTAVTQVNEINCNCAVYLPNTFTPDFDGLNDVFGPVSECDFQEFELMIFDRWGELLYRTTDPAKPWDGSYAGRTVPLGVYAWRLSYMTDRVRGSRVDYQSGSINVLR